MPFKAEAIVLDDQTRSELERRVRATTTPQRDLRRAMIIPLAADGVSSRKISRQVSMHESHVAIWRQRFLADGLDDLNDAPRPGRTPIYGHDGILKMAALATTVRNPDEPEATWTYQGLGRAAR